MAASSTTQHENLKLLVHTKVESVKDTMTDVDRQRVFLEEWEQRLQRREAELNRREQDLSQREGCGPVPDFRARRLNCDYCQAFLCNRGFSCLDAEGRILHRHHNCVSCHKEWKTYGAKGTGKASPWRAA